MSTLMGENQAETRLRGEMRQHNTGGIEYPSDTNSRGYIGGRGEQYVAGKGERHRENHADGDVVGGMPMQGMGNANMMQQPMMYQPQQPQQNFRRGGSPRRKACHADGEMVKYAKGYRPARAGMTAPQPRQNHSFGSFLKDFGNGFVKGFGGVMKTAAPFLPMLLNEGGEVNPRRRKSMSQGGREEHGFGGLMGGNFPGGPVAGGPFSRSIQNIKRRNAPPTRQEMGMPQYAQGGDVREGHGWGDLVGPGLQLLSSFFADGGSVAQGGNHMAPNFRKGPAAMMGQRGRNEAVRQVNPRARHAMGDQVGGMPSAAPGANLARQQFNQVQPYAEGGRAEEFNRHSRAPLFRR